MTNHKPALRLLKSIKDSIQQYKKENLKTYKNAGDLFKSLGI